MLIIGEGWNNSLLSNNKNIDIVNCSYREKNNFLNECKTFLNLSLIEGGPVTLLEAIAAGCNCISKNNGFSCDIAIEFPQKCKDMLPRKCSNIQRRQPTACGSHDERDFDQIGERETPLEKGSTPHWKWLFLMLYG